MQHLEQRPRRYEDAAEAIRQYIVEHGLGPGDLLPSERQLQDGLGISRASVREALRVLQMMGLVESHPGRGLFVKEPDLQPLIEAYMNSLELISDRFFAHLLDLRDVLEPGAAALAARHRLTSDLIEMEATLDSMRTKISRGERPLEEDLRFHQILIRATGNPLLRRLYEAISPFLVRVRQPPGAPDGPFRQWPQSDWDLSLAHHAALYRAIRDQDAIGAVQLMHEHLSSVRGHFEKEESKRGRPA